MPDVNIPLLRKAVEWAEAEAMKPIEMSRWEQTMWVTTPQDQAYSRARLAELGPRGWNGWMEQAAKRAPECGTCYCIAGYIAHEVEGMAVGRSADDAAGDLLGISTDNADELFNANNTIEDVRRIAESIAGEKL